MTLCYFYFVFLIINFMTNIIRKISFFAQNLKEAYREQRIAFHLEKNTKEIAKYKQWEELQKRLNPAVHSGKVINYSPLVLGYADCPILYREDAASALSKFLKKKIAPEEMVLSGLENNFLYSKFNIVFFTTVWLYQNTYFAELGTTLGKKRSKLGFLDSRMYHIQPLQPLCAPRAIIITYYGLSFNAMPHCSLYYAVENGDVKPLSLVSYGDGNEKNTEVIEIYKTKVSYAEILAAAKKRN